MKGAERIAHAVAVNTGATARSAIRPSQGRLRTKITPTMTMGIHA
jgi:hypothetical protein